MKVRRILSSPIRAVRWLWDEAFDGLDWVRTDIDKYDSFWDRFWWAVIAALVVIMGVTIVGSAVWGIYAAATNMQWWGFMFVFGGLALIGGMVAVFMHQPRPDPEPETEQGITMADLPTPIRVTDGIGQQNIPANVERNLAPNNQENPYRNDTDAYDALRAAWPTQAQQQYYWRTEATDTTDVVGMYRYPTRATTPYLMTYQGDAIDLPEVEGPDLPADNDEGTDDIDAVLLDEIDMDDVEMDAVPEDEQ